jgi:phospholipid/cholesterol/gamma-HCH transport system substrate-binding protein
MAASYRREEIKAGVTILVSVVILALGILLVGRGGFETTPKRYRIEFGGVGGLEEGAQVRFGGVKVGRVLRITPPGKDSPLVQVLIGVRKDVVVRAGTEATISTLGLVGEHYIELTNPKPAPGEIPQDGLIAAKDQTSMAEVLRSVRDVGEAAKTFLARAQAVVDGPMSDVIRRTASAVDTGDRALKGAEQVLSAENREAVRKALANVSGILEENRAPIRTAVADLEALIKRTDGVMADGGGLLRKLDGAVDEKGGDLKGMLVVMKADLERARVVLDNLDRAVTNFDHAITGNLDNVEATLYNLRRASQNARELTQDLKERPWQVLFPQPLKERDGVR